MTDATNLFTSVPSILAGGLTGIRCAACHNDEDNEWVIVKGPEATRFRFSCCASCGTLMLENPEQALSSYTDTYYSFTDTRGSRIERVATRFRNRFERTGACTLGRLISKIWPGPRHRSIRPLVAEQILPSFDKTADILDVGCGAGDWLKELRNEGFSSLAGCDPFLERDFDEKGITLRQGGPERFDKTFDVITAHHSFEHEAKGEAVLASMRDQLSDEGVLIIRIPLAASYGWEKYGGHWVQLDPPYHACLYSVAGMTTLASRVGLELIKTVLDSTHFMVTGSEAHVAGLRSHTQQLANKRLPQKVFSRRRANMIANLCNMLGTADQAAFYFRKST